MFGIKKKENPKIKNENDNLKNETDENSESKDIITEEIESNDIKSDEMEKEKLMDDDEIEEKMRKGFIRARIIFEIIGKPKEHIEETLKKYIEEIKSKSDVLIISKEFASGKEIENSLFATFCEIDLLVEKIEILTDFCYSYLPASIEIIEPENMEMTNVKFSNIFNDLLLRLHEVSMELKKVIGHQKFAEGNNVKLIYNLVLLSLKNGKKTLKEIQEDTNVNEDDLIKFLNELVSMNYIKKEDEYYSANVVVGKNKKEISENKAEENNG